PPRATSRLLAAPCEPFHSFAPYPTHSSDYRSAVLPLPLPPLPTLFPYTTLFRSPPRPPNSGGRRVWGARGGRGGLRGRGRWVGRSEEHTSELQSLRQLVCRLLLEKKKARRC